MWHGISISDVGRVSVPLMLDRVLIGIVFGGGVGNDDDNDDDAHFILYSLPLLSAIDLI